MHMKKPFNHKSQQTYASKQEELLDHAQKIDALLQTPKAPGMGNPPQKPLGL